MAAKESEPSPLVLVLVLEVAVAAKEGEPSPLQLVLALVLMRRVLNLQRQRHQSSYTIAFMPCSEKMK